MSAVLQIVREQAADAPAEFIRLIRAAATEAHRGFYLVQGLGGMRVGEAIGLAWTNVSFETGAIAVRQQMLESGHLTERLKTRRSRREVEMFAPVSAALAGLRAATMMAGELVFANRDGSPFNIRWQNDDPWRRTLLRAEVPFRKLSNLRHTYTSFMLAAGKPIQWIASQLGHVGGRKIDEVYGRWVNTPANARLDLGDFFEQVMASSVEGAARIAVGKPYRKAKTQNTVALAGLNCPGRESNPDLRFRRPP